MPFVGRQIELAVLRDQLEIARAGRPQLVLIEGTAGIGKTALVDCFLVQTSDAQIIRASGEESEMMLEYGLIGQLLASAARAGSPGKSGSVPLEDHLKVGAKLLEVLGGLQQHGSVIIVIDDLQWADQPSLRALVFVLRRLLADQVMTLLVVREEEADVLPEGLGRLIRDRGGTILKLHGLQPAELQELAALEGLGSFPPRSAERLHEHTEGNPLHARALLHEIPADAWGTLDSSLPAPRSFSLLVLGWRGKCSEEAAGLVDAASVLGLQCLLGSAARLAGIDDPLQALDEASSLGLLQPVERVTKRAIRFPHPLVRAAVYHGLSAVNRARLHLKAAEVVENQASSLRHRVAAAPGPDSTLAHELGEFAKEEAGRGAWVSAAAQLISASRLSPTTSERERLLLEAVNYMLFGGNLSEAGAYSEEIAGFVPSARRDSVLGQLALQRGLPREAEQLLQSAWQQCDPAAQPELASSIALQNAVHMLAQIRGAEGAEWARRALQLSATPGNPVAFRALGLLSLTLAYGSQPAEARAVLGSLKLTGEAGPNDWALIIRGLLRMVEDDLPNALSDLRLAASTALQRGLLQGAASALGWLATAEYYSGEWDDALRHAEQAVLVNTESERQYRAFVASAVVAVPAARGDWSLADEHALMVARQFPGYESSIASAAMAGAELATAHLDHQGVIDALQPVLGFTHRQGIDEPGFWPWQDLYADALVGLGRVVEADSFLRPHESRAAERGRRSMMARLARVRGRIEAAKELPEEAEAAFVRALQHIKDLQMPFEQARIQLAYGSFLRRLGSRRAAAAQLRSAHANLIELGAEPYLARCERELAACGLTPRGRRDQDRIGLTPQEVTVARLVASGLTNREVAAELFLSTKTIESHLSQIFGKLGISSRRQIAKHMPVSARPSKSP
jgi:DNA-binding NarL/FixJ family response regulator